MTGQAGDRFFDFDVRIPTKQSFFACFFGKPVFPEKEKWIISWGSVRLGHFFGCQNSLVLDQNVLDFPEISG
tara:strand:+ start:230 stop:445 length:216 start_codon:yes stop_codon:yes gene_type:complete